MDVLRRIAWLWCLVGRVETFSVRPTTVARQPWTALDSSASAAAISYNPLFDFTRPETVEKFDRIDDVIMGGISSSSMQFVPNASCSRWFGICRTDGGGFCGIRTLPFEEPLNVTDADGFYLRCKLVSDDEPDRRIWKISTRTRPDRGERVYQAKYQITDGPIRIPFDSFRLVQGPRMVPDGPPLNVTGGLYQIGMTLSKFDFAVKNVTQMANFRDGFFDLQIEELGVYKKGDRKDGVEVTIPGVLSKAEASRQRPLLLKVVLPVASLVFSEKIQRRKSALRLLTQDRKLSRAQAVRFGFRRKAATSGVLVAALKTICLLVGDALRALLSGVLRVALLYPLRLVRSVTKLGGKRRRAAVS